MIHGNTEGIRKTTLEELEKLYDNAYPPDLCLPPELVLPVCAISGSLNREISIYLSRGGKVLEVAIGGTHSVQLSDMHQRRNQDRLSTVRCIHTHPGGDATLSDVDLSALRLLRLDAMIAVGVSDGTPTYAQAAFLGEMEQGVPVPRILAPVPFSRVPQADWMQEILISERLVTQGEGKDLDQDQEQRTILVGMEGQDSLTELRRLAETAGFTVLEEILQKRAKPDHTTYIGSGKADELALLAQGLEATLVVFDDELSGAQVRNLENKMPGVEVIDRTTLILAIFAQRAQSYEGRLQVELAQLSYQLPRLVGQGMVLSRQAGSSGSVRSRGPGETQLELDRRHIHRRMAELKQGIENLKKQRALRRSRRSQNEVPVVALVGYTNAGKSTLLNRLSGSDALAENKLFATLDPLTRQVKTASGQPFLLVDTVGFIHKLPHALVDAFRATLEEVQLADLLLVVSDLSSPQREHERRVVDQVLEELGAAGKPTLEVLNKADLPADGPAPEGIEISALDGEGIDALLKAIDEALSHLHRTVCLLIPYDQGDVLSSLHQAGAVREEAYLENGTRVLVQVDAATYARLIHRLGEGALCEPEAEEASVL